MTSEEEIFYLLKEVLSTVEGCHDCVNYSGSDDLWERLKAAGVYDEPAVDGA